MVDVTLSIPNDVYQHAERLSETTRQHVSDILADALAFTLPTMDDAMAREAPVSKLADEDILALAASKISDERDERLSDLLYKQRENLLAPEEAAELLFLMLIYYSGWWRKAEALAEAVKRGLRPPLAP